MIDTKYKAYFEAVAKVIDNPPKILQEEAFASIKKLKNILPKDINIDESPDLLFISSALVRVGICNANGDCLSLETAKEIYKKWINKFVDLEHDRKRLVGVVINAEFVDSETNEVVDESEVDDYEGDLSIAYAAAVWKVVSPKLCQILMECSDETSDKYNAVSSSLELGFNSSLIAVGPSLYLKDAKILTNPKDIKKYEPYLKSKKGSGKDSDGNNIFRVVSGMVIPTGIGLVGNPASQVKGVLTIESSQDIEETDEDEETELESSASATSISAEKNEKNTQNAEIQSNSSVNPDNPITMIKITKVEDIVGSLFKEEATASAVASFIATEIAKSSEQYVKQLDEQKNLAKNLEEAKASAEAATKSLQDESNKLKERLAELAAQLNKIEEEKTLAKNEADFQTRMSGFESEYDLDDEDRKVLASDIRACKTEEEFVAFAAKMKPLMKEKCKSVKKAKAEALKASLEEAVSKGGSLNVKVDIDEKTLNFKEVLASVKEDKQTNLPNGVVPPEETLAQRMTKAFGGAISYNGRKAEKK